MIERASMDGRDRKVLIDTELEHPIALTLDYETKTLYWTDTTFGKIESSDTDGLNRILLYNGSYARCPLALTIFNDRLYWSDCYWHYYFYRDYTWSQILTTQVNDPTEVQYMSTTIVSSTPLALRVVTDQRQPQGDNIYVTH